MTDLSLLKNKAMSALRWNTLETFGRQGLQFGLAVVLARILSPEDFGLMAIVIVLVSIGNCLAEGGFGQALIQKEHVSRDDESSAFFVTMALSTIASLVLFVAAPEIARFFTMPDLLLLSQAMAITFIVSGAGGVPFALLTKQCRFKELTLVSGATAITSSTVAVILAWSGWGVWSLVGQAFASAVIGTVVLWAVSAWRPLMRIRLASVCDLFRFGSYIAGANLLETVLGRLNTLFIGKIYSPIELGFYSRAESTRAFPSLFAASVLNRSVFPLMSTLAGDRDKLRSAYSHAMDVVFFLNTPLMLGLAVCAEPLVNTLFGSRWLAAAPFLQVLALAGIFWLPQLVNTDLLKAAGEPAQFFRVELFKKLLLVGVVLVSSQISILAMAWGQVVVNSLAFVYGLSATTKCLGIGAAEQIARSWRIFAAAALMAAAASGALYLQRGNGALALLLAGASGTVVYFAACKYFSVQAMSQMFAVFAPAPKK
jgi:O-antigen/teichoic acid export membrane protein